ncbi:hypothetical protein PZ938_16620 [Luteipulveratus sp. YIM 133132]|uniref:hypothetical protein n=1 Tax=Luteipulveratus flavus TaxID=3031728 RepID=UPI0023B0654C|nr:hypothetical protein [Luteipulveratus sp. YIM 133132]MDE9367245.1 hypothetical protein [Luteipulveratus sp. YIM 133132]
MDDATWFDPIGYESVALSVLDSIYSTGNRYAGVLTMLSRYRALRRAEGADPECDGRTELIKAIERCGGVSGFVKQTGYRWRTSTRAGAPYKAEAALGAATALRQAQIATRADVQAVLSAPEQQDASVVKSAWLAQPGQRSGLTWSYFLMLNGVPGVKADRMVTRYVGSAVRRHVDARDAAALVSALADERGINRTKLDHAIWRKESGRPVCTTHTGPSGPDGWSRTREPG